MTLTLITVGAILIVIGLAEAKRAYWFGPRRAIWMK
jgi:hypothetical protein